ncbi:alpha/beta hydrolase [Luteimonas sp. Y-2-2-4F]|nr:alpha/beta hydrolase [Luteimonas sp. Y-2-2-4F]MCD9031971.1 alpha/beta hydrolase [Luteimonas sp. Y-2-2-4F]
MTGFDHRSGRHLDVDGARIYHEVRGRADGPALVLLHGGFGDLGTFDALAERLGRTYRLVGIDSRGQGASTLGDAPLDYRRIARDAEAVAGHLGLRRYGVIGHSDGGIAALRMAAGGAPVACVAAIGAHWTLAADDPARAMYAGITADAWRGMFPGSEPRYRALNPEPDFERLAVAMRTLWLDDGGHGYPGAAVNAIACPLLVVRGDEDPLVSRRHAAELADRVAGARLLNLPYAGHSPHEERPDWLLPPLEAFLADAGWT